MNFKKILFLLILFMFSGSVAYAGSVTLTTYYPSPFGAYDQLQLVPRGSAPTCDASMEGLLYYDGGQDKVKICQNDGTWNFATFEGLWEISPAGDSLYPKDFANPNLFVGIGTDTPATHLHVKSDISTTVMIEGDAANARVGVNMETASRRWGVFVDNSDSDKFKIKDITPPPTGIERLTIDTSGNVGIGTTSPGHSLEVNGTSLQLTQNGANTSLRTRRDPQGVITSLQAISNPSGRVGTESNHSLEVVTNNIVRMTFDTSGNVGIGTTDTATRRLRIGFGGFNGLSIFNPLAGGSEWELALGDNGLGIPGVLSLGYRGASGGGIGGGDHYNVMTLRTDGNVGIGTTSPGTKLEVAGMVAPRAAAHDPPNGIGVELEYRTGDKGYLLSYDRTGSAYRPMYYGASAHYIMNGNVGIETTTPNSPAPNAATTGNVDANDVYLRSVGKWASEVVTGVPPDRGSLGWIGDNCPGGGLCNPRPAGAHFRYGGTCLPAERGQLVRMTAEAAEDYGNKVITDGFYFCSCGTTNYDSTIECGWIGIQTTPNDGAP